MTTDNLTVCLKCGAAVLDAVTHDTWHRELVNEISQKLAQQMRMRG